MADKKLARYATVGGVTYGPGDELPADVRESLAGNPHVWRTDEEEAEAEAAGADIEPGTSNGARLATHVTYGGVTYGPDSPIPDDVAEALAGNPHIWAEGKAPRKAEARKAAKAAEQEAEKQAEAGNGSPQDANAEALAEVTQEQEKTAVDDEDEPGSDSGPAAGSKPARGSRSRAK